MIGTKVEIFSSGAWHRGKVLQVQPGKYIITFDQFSDSWNKWVTKQELRLPVTAEHQRATDQTPGELSTAMRERMQAPSGSVSPESPAGSDQTNPSSSEDPAEGQVPQLQCEDWSGNPFPYDHSWIRSRRFVAMMGGSQWATTKPSDAERPIDNQTIPLSASTAIGDGEQFLPSLNRKRALLLRGQQATALNLESGEAIWRLSQYPEPNMKLLAINDDGSRIVFAINGSENDPQGLRVYDVDELSARVLWQWRPVPESHAVQRALGAYWLTNERLGILDENRFEV